MSTIYHLSSSFLPQMLFIIFAVISVVEPVVAIHRREEVSWLSAFLGSRMVIIKKTKHKWVPTIPIKYVVAYLSLLVFGGAASINDVAAQTSTWYVPGIVIVTMLMLTQCWPQLIASSEWQDETEDQHSGWIIRVSTPTVLVINVINIVVLATLTNFFLM